MHTPFELENCKGRHRLGDLPVGEKTTLKWILEKYYINF
jgi:hypothetical protein